MSLSNTRTVYKNMRKSKKEIISIALAFILVIASIVTMIVKKELDIKLLILTAIMLIITAGEIIIAKQRNGPIGTVKMAWIPEQTRFADLLERGPRPQ